MAFRNRLTAREIQSADKDVCDGSGLWLQVTPALGGKSWLLRYRFDGRARQLGLGSALTTTLAEARKRAQEARDLIARGIDPRERRDVARAERLASLAKRKTFEQCFRDYIETHRAGWKSAKHAAQWGASQAYDRAQSARRLDDRESACPWRSQADLARKDGNGGPHPLAHRDGPRLCDERWLSAR